VRVYCSLRCAVPSAAVHPTVLRLTDPVKLLADLSGDGQARGDVHTALGHLTQVGTLATQLQVHSSSARVQQEAARTEGQQQQGVWGQQ
jgi:hypothetical protein